MQANLIEKGESPKHLNTLKWPSAAVSLLQHDHIHSYGGFKQWYRCLGIQMTYEVDSILDSTIIFKSKPYYGQVVLYSTF